MIRAMSVVVAVPTSSANAPQLGSLPAAGVGSHPGLVEERTRDSFGTIGAASLNTNRKMAASPTMLLQPQTRMTHSVGLSNASKTLNFLDFLREAAGGPETVGARASTCSRSEGVSAPAGLPAETS